MSAAMVFPALDNTMGAIFVGVILGAALWGISCMQTSEYFSEDSRKDPWLTKATVTTLLGLNTLHQILVTHVIYVYLISEHFNFAYLNVVVWSLVVQVFVSAFIALIVQTFFVYRIWILSHRNIYIVACVQALVVGTFIITIYYSVQAWHVKTFTNLPSVLTLGQGVNAMTAITDITIAAVLIFILYRSKTGFAKCDSIINQLILYSLNTGSLTSVCAFFSLLVASVFPQTLIFVTFFIPCSRLYINSLLATLNARRKLRTNSGTSHSLASDSNHTRQRSETRFNGANSQDASQTLAIRIDTRTAKGYDSSPSPSPTPGTPKKKGFELSVFPGSEKASDAGHSV